MRILLFANTEWYLFNFRRSLAEALREAGHDVLLVSPPGPYGARLEQLGFRWIPAPMERSSLNLLKELRLIHWLYRLMALERVDLVHGFTIKCAVYGSIAGRIAQVPARVTAVAGMGYVFTSNDLRARILRPLVRILLRLALGGESVRLILQNPDDVALFREAGVFGPERVRLIPGSGVDCGRFTPAGSQRTDGESLRVLFPARLLWDKGIAEFVEAARLLRAQRRNIEFLVAGEPDSHNPAAVPTKTIESWIEEGTVRWLGHVSDMPAVFRTVDVVALPSYREGLPKGLIEAAACGLAIVTTDAPGCREVVTDEIDGLLVPVRNGAALAGAIARLQDDSALQKRLGQAARLKVLERFDERIVIDQTLGVYRELLPGA